MQIKLYNCDTILLQSTRRRWFFPDNYISRTKARWFLSLGITSRSESLFNRHFLISTLSHCCGCDLKAVNVCLLENYVDPAFLWAKFIPAIPSWEPRCHDKIHNPLNSKLQINFSSDSKGIILRMNTYPNIFNSHKRDLFLDALLN